ncbi:MAG: hypothetical protein ACK454_09985 [Flavobacteriales bacterium]|jgi:hypothetical protein
MTPNEYYEYFKKDLDLLNDNGLIERFNQSVGLCMSDSMKSIYS